MEKKEGLGLKTDGYVDIKEEDLVLAKMCFWQEKVCLSFNHRLSLSHSHFCALYALSHF